MVAVVLPKAPVPLIEEAEAKLQATVWPAFEQTTLATTRRVLEAMQRHRLGEEHFHCVTGYGHNDMGRELLDKVFADVFESEAAIVRPQFVSGTHAIATALQACLKPGDLLLSLTGPLYDTIEPVLGLHEPVSPRSLKGQGIRFETLNPFTADWVRPELVDNFTYSDEEAKLISEAKVLYLQRSKGYSLRPSLRIDEMESLLAPARQLNPSALVVVDNCYGEFIETQEPSFSGADLIIGSLIKNPGGGLAKTGAYIAGKAELVEACAEVLTCPGIGSHGGYMAEQTQTMLQGLFMAPTVVKDSLKGMSLAAYVFEQLGYDVRPKWNEPRADIIQTLYLQNADTLKSFCRAIQSASPVSSYVQPIPSEVPGYNDPVIMAGGTFIDGSSIELSADAPLREPYALFLQGGLNYAHCRLALEQVLVTLQNP